MKTVALFTVMLAAMTCGGSVGNYDVAVHNGSKETIDDAHVVYGNFRSIGGSIPPGVSKRHLDVHQAIPERATVEWRTADGLLHKKDVAVKSVVGDRFTGVINFEIGENEQVRVWGEAK